MNWKVLVAGLLLVTPLVWVLATGFGRDPRAVPTTTIGTPAADFDLVTLEGERVSLSELRGQPVVLNFWATWCQPCVQEHAGLQAAARRHQPKDPEGKGVHFFGVLYGDEEEAERARAYLARAGSAYPTLLDTSQHIVVDYGVAGVPETFFISSEGTIVYKHSGAIGRSQLESILESLR